MAQRSEGVERLPGEVLAPPYAFVQSLVEERERFYGTTAVTVAEPALSWNAGEEIGAARRSKTLRNREIRLRRMLLVEPRIPEAYAKTTQRVRAGQALLGDMALRIPAMLLDKPFQVRVAPLEDERSDMDDARALATKIERFVQSYLLGTSGRRAFLDRGRSSVWRDMMDNLVNAGEGVFLLIERRDTWSESSPGFPKLEQFVDDGEEIPASRRLTAGERYRQAVQAYKRQTPAFELRSIDPQSVYIKEDLRGLPDEAVIVERAPFRETLCQHGLLPVKHRYGIEGEEYFVSADKRRAYEAGPNGFGKPYPLSGFPGTRYQPDSVEIVQYYCSAERARALGLTDGSDSDLGVWAEYVDGVCVAFGGLWGPSWHPLPVFASYGLTTAIPDPNYRGIPQSLYLIELCDVLDQIMTMELHIAYWSAFPPVIEEDKTSAGGGATGLPETADIDPESLQRPGAVASGGIKYLEPTKFYEVPPGKTWRYFVMPSEATVHLERLYVKAQELFDLLGLPGVFRGQGGASQPGYAIAQLLIAARSLFNPLVDNAKLTVSRAVQYLLWQIWKRFDEGISVYTGMTDDERKTGWITLGPGDIAPGARNAGEGVPWLECTVELSPMLPVDESLLERRGQEAVNSGMLDRYTAREKYYNDPAPEKTAARIMAQKAEEHPIAVANALYRMLVRSGELVPELAVILYAKEFGIEPQQALEQLRVSGALTPEQAQVVQRLFTEQRLRQQAIFEAAGSDERRASAALSASSGLRPGVSAPGMAPVGAPNLPPVAPNLPATGVPTPPPAPVIRPGGARRPPTQPAPEQRQARMLAS